jgi:hypothetical protein
VTEAEIHAIADRLDPAIRAAWLKAVNEIRRRLSRARVDRLLRARSAAAFASAVQAIAPDATMAPLLNILRAGATTSATREVARMTTSFRHVSATAVRTAELAAGARVVSITNRVRQLIRAEVVRSVKGEQTPQQAAKAIARVVGLTPRQARALSRQRDAMIAAGATERAADAWAAKEAARRIRERAKVIARTEAIAASNAGQIAAWKALQGQGLIPPDAQKRWVVTRDDRLCPVCAPMAGQTVPVGAEFESLPLGRILAPPLHPRCRCTVVLAVSGRRRAADAA